MLRLLKQKKQLKLRKMQKNNVIKKEQVMNHLKMLELISNDWEVGS